MPEVPVSVVPPDEGKRPPWLAPEVAASLKNPRFEEGGLWTDGSRDGTMRLVRDASTRGPAQFGHYWEAVPRKYMTWFDLWEIVREAKSGDEKAETAVVLAIEKFAAQNGVDPWGFTLETTFDDATQIITTGQERSIVHKSVADVTGDRRLEHSWGKTHRRQQQVPGPAKLSHILAGGGYSLIHLLVAKNFPRALRCLLEQRLEYRVHTRGETEAPKSESILGTDKQSPRATPREDVATESANGKDIDEAANAAGLAMAKNVEDGGTEADKPTVKEGDVVVSRMINVDQPSAQQETPLTLARSLGFIDCARVLEAVGARVDPQPSLSWLDVWRAVADLADVHAVEVVKRFRRQGSQDADGFGLNYQRMSRPERKNYTGLRGHQWWGYAQETLGWTIAHMACAKNRPLCLSELAQAGADLNLPSIRSTHRHSEITPLMIARQKGHARCIAVLMDHGGSSSAEHESANRPAVATIRGELGRDRLCEATSLPANAHQYPPPPPPSFSSPPPPIATGLAGVCPSHLAGPLSYQQLWDAIAKEPEPQAVRRLRIFMKQNSHEAVEATFRRQRLHTFDEYSGFTLAHLAAHRMQWGTLLFLFRAMRPSDRSLIDVDGRSALQIARQKRLLSATCLPRGARSLSNSTQSSTSFNHDSNMEDEADLFEVFEELVVEGANAGNKHFRRTEEEWEEIARRATQKYTTSGEARINP